MNSSLQVSNPLTTRFFRSNDGMIAGVCGGLSRTFGVDPWLVRGLWLVSVLAFGSGLLLYVILAVCLPREDRLEMAQQKRLLGVCARISRSTGIDVGLLRTLTVLLALVSFGLTAIGYVVMSFVMDDENQNDRLVY